jgi:hypothetical protein
MGGFENPTSLEKHLIIWRGNWCEFGLSERERLVNGPRPGSRFEAHGK